MHAEMDRIYAPSEDIVAREIEGELIIVPLAAGIGYLEDELYSFNESGRAVWVEFNGRDTLAQIVITLAQTYDAPSEVIAEDAVGLASELLRRRILVEVQPG